MTPIQVIQVGALLLATSLLSTGCISVELRDSRDLRGSTQVDGSNEYGGEGCPPPPDCPCAHE